LNFVTQIIVIMRRDELYLHICGNCTISCLFWLILINVDINVVKYVKIEQENQDTNKKLNNVW